MENNESILKENAEKVLGLEVNPLKVKTSQVTCQAQFIPFLNSSLEDETTWKNNQMMNKLHAEDLHIITKRKGIPRFPNLKDLDVWINPYTNLVHKAISKWPENIKPIAPYPDIIDEEGQIRKVGEQFLSLPDQDPKYDMYYALKIIEEFGPVTPQAAKQYMAYLVTHRTVRYQKKTVWIIQTRGIIPFIHGYQGEGGYVSEEARNHIRHVIDAETGEWLFSDTVPQPVNI
jgi:hypothetical protein